MGQAGEPVLRDIEFAKIDGKSLKLDLYLPEKVEKPCLLVWVHGGAWRAGDKAGVPGTALLDDGFAIASVNYRLSPEAKFPAQVHDIKAAIRFLRAHAAKWGLSTERIGIIGASAGGQLAALVGVTNRHAELEGRVGDCLAESSAVQCIVSLYGASNLESILSQSTDFGVAMRVPALQLLLGGQPADAPDLARLASPVAHLDPGDPALLLIHGDADPQMPWQQSQELAGAAEKIKLVIQFVTLPGAKHGGTEFYDQERITLMGDFLKKHLSAVRVKDSQ
ncbi:MAG: alpha/beta hydrolase [Verrucomicrobiales bacterium]